VRHRLPRHRGRARRCNQSRSPRKARLLSTSATWAPTIDDDEQVIHVNIAVAGRRRDVANADRRTGPGAWTPVVDEFKEIIHIYRAIFVDVARTRRLQGWRHPHHRLFGARQGTL